MRQILIFLLGAILFIYLNIIIMAENPCSAFSMTPSECRLGQLDNT